MVTIEDLGWLNRISSDEYSSKYSPTKEPFKGESSSQPPSNPKSELPSPVNSELKPRVEVGQIWQWIGSENAFSDSARIVSVNECEIEWQGNNVPRTSTWDIASWHRSWRLVRESPLRPVSSLLEWRLVDEWDSRDKSQWYIIASGSEKMDYSHPNAKIDKEGLIRLGHTHFAKVELPKG